MFLLSKSAVRWCVRFCIWCSCILSQHNKNEEHSKEHSSFLVRFVQTYSVFKQIAKSICNEYSICFSSQKLPYSGASVFVLWGSSPYNPKNNKKAIRYKYLMAFLVRWKGLEPPTYWFVASHSIQLSYQRRPIKIYQLIQLLTKYPQVDLVFRSQSLYPAELPAHICVALFVLQ